MTKDEVVGKVKRGEVERVMVHPEEAIPTARARLGGFVPTVLFVRNDGWILGAPEYLEAAAYKTWADSWEWFWRKGEEAPRPMSEYVKPQDAQA